jgi:hypothetical protein
MVQVSKSTESDETHRRLDGRWMRRVRRRGASVGRRLRPLRRALTRLRENPGGAREIHVLWSEDPSRSLTICWASQSRHNPALVQFRTRGDDHWTEIRGRTVPRPGPSGYLHTALLDDLEPDTRIDYRVSSDPGHCEAFSQIKETRTAPIDAKARFEVVFVCDMGLVGRSDRTTCALPDVLAALRAVDPLFVLGGGDYVYADRDHRYLDPADAISAWFEQMAPLFARAPFMAQLGNHEVGFTESAEDWTPRLPRPVDAGPGFSRSFDVGGAHFVGLHAPGCAPTPADLEWLVDDLSSARARAASWRIVYQHAPVFAHGASHPARPELRSLVPLLGRLGVDLHLSGHDQSYERTHVVAADGSWTEPVRHEGRSVYPAGRGVLYAKVSPAGKLSDRGLDFSRLSGIAPKTIAVGHDAAHHWARLQIDQHVLRVIVDGVQGPGEPVTTFDDFSLTRAHL